jgi:hypothetical protein
MKPSCINDAKAAQNRVKDALRRYELERAGCGLHHASLAQGESACAGQCGGLLWPPSASKLPQRQVPLVSHHSKHEDFQILRKTRQESRKRVVLSWKSG